MGPVFTVYLGPWRRVVVLVGHEAVQEALGGQAEEFGGRGWWQRWTGPSIATVSHQGAGGCWVPSLRACHHLLACGHLCGSSGSLGL